MPRDWFKRSAPRPATPPPAGAGRPPARVVNVELYRGRTGGKDWTAEWGLLDEQTTHEITTNDLGALIEYVLADARDHVGQHLEATMQWSLHRGGQQHGTDVTGSEFNGVILPRTLYT